MSKNKNEGGWEGDKEEKEEEWDRRIKGKEDIKNGKQTNKRLKITKMNKKTKERVEEGKIWKTKQKWLTAWYNVNK